MPGRFHWRDLARQRPAPLWVHGESMHGGHPPHDHDFLELTLVESGGTLHRHAGGEERLRAGDALVVRPGTWHAYRDAAMRYWDCCVPGEVLRRELAWAAADPVLGRLLWSAPFAGERSGILRLRLDAAARAAAIAELRALAGLREARSPGARTAALGRLLVVLGLFADALGGDGVRAGAGGATHPAVARAIAILTEDPARTWTLAGLAGEVGLAPAVLTRRFAAATGLPPRAWAIRHRLELAAGLLLRGDAAVADIGAQVGWPDANLFARRFRAQYGCSASAWRARYRDALSPAASGPG